MGPADLARGIERDPAFTRSQRPRSLTILGATGSIGSSTLDLVASDPASFEIVALTANDNADALAHRAIQFRARHAVIANPAQYEALKANLQGTGITCAAGPDALIEAASMPADCVMAAIMGAAGLRASLAALKRGARLALANKECLVSAGSVFMDAAAASDGVLLPVDSEHSAIFQALEGNARSGVEKVIVTASGGPFRTWSIEEMARAKPEDALKHPNWSMGRKITIDSATMMNKGLELIEAHYLFTLQPDELDVVVHPQSIVHSLVSYRDGSVLAQLGVPDMRTPIAYALSWPDRMHAADIPRLELSEIGTLTFERPDETRFPALTLAKAAMQRGGTATGIFNAANEVAVAAFLDRQLSFPGIAACVEHVLERADAHGMLQPSVDLDGVLAADHAARELARDVIDTGALDN